jgi:quinol monooxygenase YgiN
MIKLIAQIHVLSGKTEEELQDLNNLVQYTKMEEGCLRYDLFQSTMDECIFFIFEEWHDDKSLGKHFESQHIKEFNNVKRLWISGKVEINQVKKL